MFRKYPGGQRCLFRFIRADLRFEVSNVRLSTKVVVLGQYRIYFGAMGLKDFYFWCREDQSNLKLYPKQLQTILHPSIIPDNSSIYNNCICWKVLLLRK